MIRRKGYSLYRRRRRYTWVAPCLGILFISYLFYHTIQGERGWLALMHLRNQTNQAEQTLKAVSEHRKELEDNTARLSGNGIDRDLLEEQARKNLNLSRDKDLTVIE